MRKQKEIEFKYSQCVKNMRQKLVSPHGEDTNCEYIYALGWILDYNSERIYRDLNDRLDKEIYTGAYDPSIYIDPDINKRNVVFENILMLKNRFIQHILRDMDDHVLAVALMSTPEEVSTRVFNNLSKRHAESIREYQEDVDRWHTHNREEDIKDAQQKIANIIAESERRGEIFLMRGNDIFIDGDGHIEIGLVD
jgi:hypothetical protein